MVGSLQELRREEGAKAKAFMRSDGETGNEARDNEGVKCKRFQKEKKDRQAGNGVTRLAKREKRWNKESSGSQRR